MLTLRRLSHYTCFIVMAWICLQSPQALAQQTLGTVSYPCFQEAAAGIGEEARRAVDRDKAAYDRLIRDFMEGNHSTSLIDQMSACVNTNFNFNFSFTLPSIAEILRAIVRNLIRQACAELRSQLSGINNPFRANYYINSGVPGMPRYGGGIGGGGMQGHTLFLGPGAQETTRTLPQGFVMPNVPSTITWKNSSHSKEVTP